MYNQISIPTKISARPSVVINMIIAKFVWRGTNVAKTVLKVKTKVQAIRVSGETWRAGAVIPTVVLAGRGAHGSAEQTQS